MELGPEGRAGHAVALLEVVPLHPPQAAEQVHGVGVVVAGEGGGTPRRRLWAWGQEPLPAVEDRVERPELVRGARAEPAEDVDLGPEHAGRRVRAHGRFAVVRL